MASLTWTISRTQHHYDYECTPKEYCAHDLAALVDTLPVAFEEDQVKCLVLQLVRGVEWLHLKFIVHRDLKLSNLLLTDNGILKVVRNNPFSAARKPRVLSRSGGWGGHHLSIPDATGKKRIETVWFVCLAILYVADTP